MDGTVHSRSGLNESMCQILRLSVQCFCVAMGYASKVWLSGNCTLDGAGLTPKMLCLIMVRYPTKFSTCIYSGWSVEIMGMKNLGIGVGLQSSYTELISGAFVSIRQNTGCNKLSSARTINKESKC